MAGEVRGARLRGGKGWVGGSKGLRGGFKNLGATLGSNCKARRRLEGYIERNCVACDNTAAVGYEEK